MIELIIPGKPQGKARARTFKVGNYSKTITPEKTVLYENWIKSIWNGSGNEKLEGQIHMTIKCYFEIPKSKSKKIKEEMKIGIIRPTTKPDVDNIAKVICDALNGLAYHDDSQIVSLFIEKHYTESPRVEVSVEPTGLAF